MIVSMETPAQLPLEALITYSPFALVDGQGTLISEEKNTPDAVRLLAKHVRENQEFNGAIYRRTATGWTKY